MKHLLKLPLCALAFAMTANTGFAQSSATGLKDAYKDYFSIGVAVNMQNITNPEQIAIIKKDFNSITAENDMKPQPTEPAYGQFNWENADKIANFCRSNGIKLRGHCLMWHAQIGKWMYQDEKRKSCIQRKTVPKHETPHHSYYGTLQRRGIRMGCSE